MNKLYKLVVYVPLDHADKIREALHSSGAGEMGNYDQVTFSARGMGRFRPLAAANPAIGEVGKLELVEEERIETVVTEDIIEKVLSAVRAAHPYEEPAIDIYELYE
ncbi:MAG TPA: hypothetical protein VJH25_00020 [Candidatus Paceibacterota bacterium]